VLGAVGEVAGAVAATDVAGDGEWHVVAGPAGCHVAGDAGQVAVAVVPRDLLRGVSKVAGAFTVK
jgi:hypothetical protein